MKSVLAALFFGLGCLAANAQTWVLISNDATNEYWGQDASLQIAKTPNGVVGVSILGKTVNKQTHASKIEQWQVAVDDCARQRGRFAIGTADGLQYIRHYDFVFGERTAPAINAQAICEAYRIKSAGR